MAALVTSWGAAHLQLLKEECSTFVEGNLNRYSKMTFVNNADLGIGVYCISGVMLPNCCTVCGHC